MKLYPYYVMHNGKIVSAWETRSDASDFIAEHTAEYGDFTIKTQAQLVRAGIKPGQRGNWINLPGHGHVVRNSKNSRPANSNRIHEVVVGNIGTVYLGSNTTDAKEAFNKYCNASTTARRKAYGEPVSWLIDGEVFKDYHGETLSNIQKRAAGISLNWNPNKEVSSKLPLKFSTSDDIAIIIARVGDVEVGKITKYGNNFKVKCYVENSEHVHTFKTIKEAKVCIKYWVNLAEKGIDIGKHRGIVERNPNQSLIQAKVDKIENESYNHILPILTKHGISGSHTVAKTHAQKIAATAHKHLLNS